MLSYTENWSTYTPAENLPTYKDLNKGTYSIKSQNFVVCISPSLGRFTSAELGKTFVIEKLFSQESNPSRGTKESNRFAYECNIALKADYSNLAEAYHLVAAYAARNSLPGIAVVDLGTLEQVRKESSFYSNYIGRLLTILIPEEEPVKDSATDWDRTIDDLNRLLQQNGVQPGVKASYEWSIPGTSYFTHRPLFNKQGRSLPVENIGKVVVGPLMNIDLRKNASAKSQALAEKAASVLCPQDYIIITSPGVWRYGWISEMTPIARVSIADLSAVEKQTLNSDLAPKKVDMIISG